MNKINSNNYLANSANCFGSLRSKPGMPPGGNFLPVIYSVKSASDSDTLESSSSLTLSSPKNVNFHITRLNPNVCIIEELAYRSISFVGTSGTI